MYSPAVMDGAAPSTVTRSRCPRTLVRSTQKPLSALWKVTRSTRPANGSRSLDEPDPAVSRSRAEHLLLRQWDEPFLTELTEPRAGRFRAASGLAEYWITVDGFRATDCGVR